MMKYKNLNTGFTPLEKTRILSPYKVSGGLPRETVNTQRGLMQASAQTTRECHSLTGFTLVELLISLVIIFIIFSLGYIIFSGVSISWNRGQAQVARYEFIREFFDNLSKEIPAMIQDEGRGIYCLGINKSETALKPESKANELFFVFSVAQEGKNSDLVEVGYWLKADGSLMRHFQHDPDFNYATSSRDDKLFSNIKNLTFEYYDGTNWQNAWNSEITKKLPRAIKITIAIGEERGLQEQTFSTVINVQTA